MIAQALGVPPRTVKSWRLGKRMPRPAVAKALAKLTASSLEEIYAGAPSWKEEDQQ